MSDPRLYQRAFGAYPAWSQMDAYDAEMNGETPETLEEYDEIEEQVANSELCSVDGKPCHMEHVEEMYGEDRDGNRGIVTYYKRCRKCGDER
jgi:hypothetical protein